MLLPMHLLVDMDAAAIVLHATHMVAMPSGDDLVSLNVTQPCLAHGAMGSDDLCCTASGSYADPLAVITSSAGSQPEIV